MHSLPAFDHTQGFYAVVNIATFDLHSAFSLLGMSSPGLPNELFGIATRYASAGLDLCLLICSLTGGRHLEAPCEW